MGGRAPLVWQSVNPIDAMMWLYSRWELRSLTLIYLLVVGSERSVRSRVCAVRTMADITLESGGERDSSLAASSVLDIVVQTLVVGLTDPSCPRR